LFGSRKSVLADLSEQCDQILSRISDIENKLRNEYEVKQAAHTVTLKRSRLQEFSRLDSPSKQANFDIDLFLSKYFLDENDKPDQSKTPEPLPLPGFANRAALHQAAERISGLHTVSGGTDYSSRVLVIGWDRDKVRQEASRIGREQASEQKEERDEEWEEKMQDHRDYVARCKGVKGSKAFQAKYAVGSYIIECKRISEGWSDADDLTMNITQADGPVELVADFDFGIVEGIMRLSFDAKLLSEPSESENDEEDEYDEEGYGDDDDEPTFSGTKRKPAAQRAKPQATKKSKASKAHPRRLYLQWRGRETGEGQIQLDYDNKHTGYLDFTDAGCTAFEGVAFFGFVGPRVPFRGFKVSDKGGKMTKSWSDYSENAYEYARKARWR
jgi:hypothetical protein